MADNPLGPLSRLMKRLKEDSKPLGLALQQFTVQPNINEDGPSMAQAIFVLDEDRPTVEVVVDQKLSNELDEYQKEQQQARAEKARTDLEELRKDLSNPKHGIGLDD